MMDITAMKDIIAMSKKFNHLEAFLPSHIVVCPNDPNPWLLINGTEDMSDEEAAAIMKHKEFRAEAIQRVKWLVTRGADYIEEICHIDTVEHPGHGSIFTCDTCESTGMMYTREQYIKAFQPKKEVEEKEVRRILIF